MAPTSRSRVQLFRSILPSTEVYKSTQDEMIKKNVFCRGKHFPKPRKAYYSKVVELLCTVVVVSINQRLESSPNESLPMGI